MSKRRDKIVVVEDDAALRDLLVQELSDRGYAVQDFGDVRSCLAALGPDVDLVVSDLRLPDGDGFDILNAVRERRDGPAIILITAFGSVPQAVEALKAGADDFLTKPLDLDHLAVRIARVLLYRRTGATLASLQETLRNSNRPRDFHGMIGDSPPMKSLYASIRRIAKVEEPVLITGESGSGKELVARAIHGQSNRAAAPFIAINCASVPESLLEAEFFGHAAGAFTGASSARRGLFREADGGSLFLDEIGEMPASLQAKLLRVLQDGRVRALGNVQEIAVDVRIIAATNRSIEADVKAGRWREDLFFRLEALSLEVPALRDRGDDILTLTTWFLAKIAAERELAGLRLSERALETIQSYSFPGNVRELGNALARAATFCESGQIEVRHLPERLRSAKAPNPPDADPLGITSTPPPTLQELELRYIRWILEHTRHNKRRAAEILNVGRRTIYRKLDEQA
ncbi:MAG: sigma-54 dependent transcriptional regulator [Woeseia sp.]